MYLFIFKLGNILINSHVTELDQSQVANANTNMGTSAQTEIQLRMIGLSFVLQVIGQKPKYWTG